MASRPAARLRVASGAVLVALSAGCSSGEQSGSERLGQASSAIFGNDQTSFDYFVGKGLTAVQAAGIVGNLDQESGDTPTAVQAGGAGRGVAQWSTGGRWDTSTGDNENAFVTNMDGGSAGIWQLGPQLDFIWYELSNFPGYGLADLQAQTTIDGATTAFMTKFEICGTCDATTRVSYAQAVYDAYGNTEYAASFVSQSFPYATTTMMMTAGQVIPSYIELKNTGTKAWDSNTKIGTTEPRDRSSVFADKTWLAPNRLAAVQGTVAPGDTYKFTFDLAAPATPGLYDEHFGVVEEGVTWFGDEGGPPDSDLEVKIQVAAAASSSNASSSSAASSSGSGAGGGASATGTGGASTGASSGAGGSEASSGSGSGSGGTTSITTGGEAGTPTKASGCAVTVDSGRGLSPAAWAMVVAVAAAMTRRRQARR